MYHSNDPTYALNRLKVTSQRLGSVSSSYDTKPPAFGSPNNIVSAPTRSGTVTSLSPFRSYIDNGVGYGGKPYVPPSPSTTGAPSYQASITGVPAYTSYTSSSRDYPQQQQQHSRMPGNNMLAQPSSYSGPTTPAVPVRGNPVGKPVKISPMMSLIIKAQMLLQQIPDYVNPLPDIRVKPYNVSKNGSLKTPDSKKKKIGIVSFCPSVKLVTYDEDSPASAIKDCSNRKPPPADVAMSSIGVPPRPPAHHSNILDNIELKVSPEIRSASSSSNAACTIMLSKAVEEQPKHERIVSANIVKDANMTDNDKVPDDPDEDIESLMDLCRSPGSSDIEVEKPKPNRDALESSRGKLDDNGSSSTTSISTTASSVGTPRTRPSISSPNVGIPQSPDLQKSMTYDLYSNYYNHGTPTSSTLIPASVHQQSLTSRSHKTTTPRLFATNTTNIVGSPPTRIHSSNSRFSSSLKLTPQAPPQEEGGEGSTPRRLISAPVYNTNLQRGHDRNGSTGHYRLASDSVKKKDVTYEIISSFTESNMPRRTLTQEGTSSINPLSSMDKKGRPRTASMYAELGGPRFPRRNSKGSLGGSSLNVVHTTPRTDSFTMRYNTSGF